MFFRWLSATSVLLFLLAGDFHLPPGGDWPAPASDSIESPERDLAGHPKSPAHDPILPATPALLTRPAAAIVVREPAAAIFVVRRPFHSARVTRGPPGV